jgi:RNA polymerase sigma-54 factor
VEQKQAQTQKQKLVLSQYQRQSLSLLALNSDNLNNLIQEMAERNPFLEVDWSNVQPPTQNEDTFENYTAAKESPFSDLIFQLHTATSDPLLRRISEYLIYALDSRGYLNCDLSDTARDLDIPIEYLEKALVVVQSLEPAGVGAQNLQESLYLQLKRQTEQFPLAIEIVRNHFEELANQDYEGLAQVLEVPLVEIKNALQAIRRLNPFPLNAENSSEVRYIVPELLVYLKDNAPVVVSLQKTPKLSLAAPPENFGDNAEIRQWSRGYLTEARQFVSAIAQRQQTLLNIGQQLVQIQRSFFTNGAAPCALTQETLAAALQVNVSTISRAICEKYLQFGAKVYPLKYFFPSHIAAGGSSEQIKTIIRSVIAGEHADHPVSDGQIARYLESIGQPISKRTVTKYRQQMGIQNAGKRHSRYGK